MALRVAGRFATQDEYTLSLVSTLLEDCAGFRDGDELAELRKKALDAYFMRPRGDEVPGRSAVISGDISAMTDAVLAQMMTAIKSKNVCSFDAEGLHDEYQAALETDCVTDVIFGQGNKGYLKLQAAVKNALLLMSGITKAWADDEPRARERVFHSVDVEAFAELTAERADVKLEHIDFQNGTLRFSERRHKKRCRIGNVDPANFVYTRNWEGELEHIPCIGERHVSTRSELIGTHKFPRKIVDEATPFADTGGVRSARNVKSAPKAANRSPDPSLDLIEWYELYVLLDTDGDGVAERRRVCIVPQKHLFSNRSHDGIPYAIGVTLLNPGRIEGVSLYVKLKQNWDIGTALLRLALDNGNAATKSRTAYLKGKVELADLEDGRVNGNIGVEGVQDVRQAVSAIVVPDISGGVLALMQEQKRSRTELGGASLELASGQAQLTDRVGSQGVDRMYSVMEQLAELMARTFAESLVADLYLLVHRTLRENFTAPLAFMRRGKAVTTIPSKWPERTSTTVNIGMSAGERQRLLTALEKNLEAQLMLSREGMTGVIVDAPKFYALLMDYNRAAEVRNPEQYYIDPDSDAAKEVVANRDRASQQEKQAQQKLMAKALGFEQLRIAMDKHDGDANRVVDVFKAILAAETAEANVVGKAAADFELAERTAEQAEQEHEADMEALGAADKALTELKGLKKNGAATN